MYLLIRNLTWWKDYPQNSIEAYVNNSNQKHKMDINFVEQYTGILRLVRFFGPHQTAL